ncbi:hypothetical protein MY3296_001422 [Beauveria thailandica]
MACLYTSHHMEGRKIAVPARLGPRDPVLDQVVALNSWGRP